MYHGFKQTKPQTVGLVVDRQEDQRLILQIPPSDKPTVIAVAVLDVRAGADKVRLAVDAPRRVKVDREEVLVGREGTGYREALLGNMKDRWGGS